ncbi:MAG: glucose-1-phosphate thymidylyltransferase [Chloroflexi bacterium]|nr:MAG: glucose-1-phosphate thymidylyltransferase [Chloroflexota bacterium]TME47495.1 MAG: glucose-1-phosphate thymidylyltransferase [Chloroflexota bacterium]
MKALILSGGKGTRLRPITHTGAKQLVPVANKPILFYAIESVVKAGISEIGMVVGDTEAEIREAVGDGERWGAHITYIRQTAPLGLAHAVKESESFLAGHSFVMYLGDNLVRDGIEAFVKEFTERRPDAMILLAPVQAPERFGVAELQDGHVVRLVEKPAEPKSDLALVGVYLFTPKIFEAVRAIRPSARGELEITDAIQWLLDHDAKVEPHIVHGWWKDTGRLEDMLEANRIVLDGLEASNKGTITGSSQLIGKVVVETGAVVENSVVRGPAIIGRGARIVNSYVGPFTSIYHTVEIRNSEIEHSIVLEGSRILDVAGRIEDSLIGKDVVIRRRQTMPKALQFMLGDHSEVELT